MRDIKIGKLGLVMMGLIILVCYLKGLEGMTVLSELLIVINCSLIIAFGYLNTKIEKMDKFKGYLFTTVLNKRKEFLNDNLMGIISISIIIQIVISLQNRIIGEYIFYLLLYIVSYSISIEKINNLQNFKIRNVLFLSWVCIVVMIGGKAFLEDIFIYENIISFYTSAGLGLGIFLITTNKKISIFKDNRSKHNIKSKIYKLGENNSI